MNIDVQIINSKVLIGKRTAGITEKEHNIQIKGDVAGLADIWILYSLNI